MKTRPNSKDLENAARAVKALSRIDPDILDAIIIRKLIPDVMKGLREAIDLACLVVTPVVPGEPVNPTLMRAIGILGRVNTELSILGCKMNDPVKNPYREDHYVKLEQAILLSRQALAPKTPDLPHNLDLECNWTSKFPEDDIADQFPQETMSLPGLDPVPEGRVIIGKSDFDEELVRGVVKSDSSVKWTLSLLARRLIAAEDLYESLDIQEILGDVRDIQKSGWNTMEHCEGWARDYIEDENELISHLYLNTHDENKPAIVKNIIVGFEEGSDQIVSVCLDYRDIMPQEPDDSPEP